MSDKQDAEKPYLRTIILNTMRLASTCRSDMWQIIPRGLLKCILKALGRGGGGGRRGTENLKWWPQLFSQQFSSEDTVLVFPTRFLTRCSDQIRVCVCVCPHTHTHTHILKTNLNLRFLAIGRITFATSSIVSESKMLPSTVGINLQTNIQKEA